MFGGDERAVTLRCANRLAGVICDRFGSETVFRLVNKEQFEFSSTVKISPTFFSWLASFGGEIKLTAPDDLIEKYKDFIKKAADAI